MAEQPDTLHFLDYWRVIRSRKEVVIAVFLLILIMGIMITFARPQVYMASAVIAVKEEQPDVPVFSREMTRYDPLFLRTQFEIIQSAPVLEEVMRKQNLVEKLSKAYGYEALDPEKSFARTFKILSRSMKVQQYRDTNLIEIRILLSEPEDRAPREAADTANMIAAVYRAQSMRRSREATERALAALHESLQEQEARVVEAEERVENVRQEYKIDVFRLAGGATDSLDKMSLAQLEAHHVQIRLELEDKRARYEKVRSLSSEKLADAAPHLVDDPAVASLVAERRAAEVERSRLLRDFGERHPKVVQVVAAIRELQQKIDEALDGLRTGVQADYEAAKAKFDALQVMLDEKRATERSAEATGYREFEKAREELAHARKIRDALEMRYIQERIELRIPRTTVEIIEPAKAADPDDPYSPNFLLNVILSILVGLSSGVAMAFFIEYLDTSLKNVEDVERYMEVPVLGVIPQKVKPFVQAAGDPSHVEAYRVLRANVQFSDKFRAGKALCVTSGSVGEGKSLTAFNLACVCAQFGDRALLVDADLHRPKQHRTLGLSNAVGLANILVGDSKPDDALQSTSIANLDFLSSGKLSPGVHALLDTRTMSDLLAALREAYDILVFDAPPMIGVSDTSLLVRQLDAALLVIQHRRYPRMVSRRAKDMIDNLGGNLIGVVLNSINISKDYSYYYHYSAYPKRQDERNA